jgi:hypothetical protein
MNNLIATMILVTTFTYSSFGQTISCSNFCITNIALDTNLANGFDIQITIEMTGSNSDFANYPHISSLINAFGDTIASGSLFWFGQIGGTTQDYPVTLLPSAICTPNFLGYSAVFVFNNDTCTLTFPCTTSLSDDDSKSRNHTIYPNPAQDEFTITKPFPRNSSNAIVTIYDQSGRLVNSIAIYDGKPINISHLQDGIYIVKFSSDNDFWLGKVIKTNR